MLSRSIGPGPRRGTAAAPIGRSPRLLRLVGALALSAGLSCPALAGDADRATGASQFQQPLAAARGACEALATTAKGAKPLPGTATIGAQAYRVVDVHGALASPASSGEAAPTLPALIAQAEPHTLFFFGAAPRADVYAYGQAITVTAPGTVLCGPGARLDALDGREAAIRVKADAVAIIGLTFTGRPETSNVWPEEFAAANGTVFPRKLSNVDNGKSYRTNASRIVLDGARDAIVADNTFQGAGRGALRLYGARNAAIIDNTITRTQSDGIHIVHGSKDVTVQGNRVRQSGDDCISVVSYQREKYPPVENVLIDGNVCEWSRTRGLTTIGGKKILIANNQVSDALRAGILLFPAPRHQTSPVENVTVLANTVRSSPRLHQRCPVCGGIVVKAGEGPGSVLDVSLIGNKVAQEPGFLALKVDAQVHSEVTMRDNVIEPAR